MVYCYSFVRWDLQSVVTLDAVDGDPNSKSHIALKRIQSPVILLYCSKDEAMWVFLYLFRTLPNFCSKSSLTLSDSTSWQIYTRGSSVLGPHRSRLHLDCVQSHHWKPRLYPRGTEAPYVVTGGHLWVVYTSSVFLSRLYQVICYLFCIFPLLYSLHLIWNTVWKKYLNILGNLFTCESKNIKYEASALLQLYSLT